jgi:hypothetical protein
MRMNGWGFLFLLASVLAWFSVPFLFFAVLMRFVGRIGTRFLIAVLALDSIAWIMAAIFWLRPSG